MSAGEAITYLLVAVVIERAGRAPVAPRVLASGARIPLPPRFMGGTGDVVVSHEGEDVVVRIEGEPPPWPLAMGWEARLLRRLLGRRIVRLVSPSSAG